MSPNLLILINLKSDIGVRPELTHNLRNIEVMETIGHLVVSRSLLFRHPRVANLASNADA